MSDDRLRELERRAKDDPGLVPVLEAERQRAGMCRAGQQLGEHFLRPREDGADQILVECGCGALIRFDWTRGDGAPTAKRWVLIGPGRRPPRPAGSGMIRTSDLLHEAGVSSVEELKDGAVFARFQAAAREAIARHRIGYQPP